MKYIGVIGPGLPGMGKVLARWIFGASLLSRASGGASALRPREVLDCTGDDDWSGFRRRLAANAEQGFPLDADLAADAQELLQKHADAMVVDERAAYGASLGMRHFFAGCNARRGAEADVPPFCLYGAVAALWVLARHGHPERVNLLSIAEFLLGGATMRNTLDFMESSAWPLSSLDVLANLQHPEEFRLPEELRAQMLPVLPPPAPKQKAARKVPSGASDGPVRIVTWEIGVHASLSAEPLQMWARLLPRAEISHRNLIQDQYPQWLPDKCQTLYRYARLTCDTVEDDITELFRRRIPLSATSKDPVEGIDDFAQEFAAAAGSRLNHVDIMLCTIAYLCLVVSGLSIPVLGYFGHPLLFMVPEGKEVREGFWSRFVALAKSDLANFAVSDPFLQMQYDYQVGAPRLPVIRTHALYTGATHFPERAGEVLVMDRPHESVLMCVIQSLLPEEAAAGEGGGQPAAADDSPDWELVDGRLRIAASPGYPFRFVTRSLTDRQFGTFAKFRAVVLWAYDMDLITFYEFYSMNMPIFMPKHLPKYLFQQDHTQYDGRWSQRREDPNEPPLWPPEAVDSPFNETSLDAVRYIVGFTDYFRFPEVQHFHSIPDLLERLQSTNYFEVVQGMARYNQDSLMESANSWRKLLHRATGWDAELLQL